MLPNYLNNWPKWRNFAKSGHTANDADSKCNIVRSRSGANTKICLLQTHQMIQIMYTINNIIASSAVA